MWLSTFIILLAFWDKVSLCSTEWLPVLLFCFSLPRAVLEWLAHHTQLGLGFSEDLCLFFFLQVHSSIQNLSVFSLSSLGMCFLFWRVWFLKRFLEKCSFLHGSVCKDRVKWLVLPSELCTHVFWGSPAPLFLFLNVIQTNRIDFMTPQRVMTFS